MSKNNRQKNEFQPFISADTVLPEFTIASIIAGILMAVVFGAANAYLGLRVGLTVSASIPAAVISMGILRVIMRRNSILENNLVQTIGSAGESVAAGAIFTLPVLFMWADEWGSSMPTLGEIALIAIVGGALGVMFMIPLRHSLIVEEHGTLPYPEGTACAEVLLAGEHGGSKSSIVFAGLGISAIFKFITDGLKLFPSEVHFETSKIGYKGGGIGVDVLPALLGVGYICGSRIASIMLCGSLLSWLVLMPLISFFGGGATIFPGTDPVNTMDSLTLWSTYIRYIGAGAVAAGGIISLIKSIPLIGKTFAKSMRTFHASKEESQIRTERNLPMPLVIFTIVAMFLIIWLVPIIPVNTIGALVIILFGFFFATVSSRLVGLVGSSNNPVSGMAIATLLIATFILKMFGMMGESGMTGAIAIGAVICIIAALAGDVSQDLKTGYIVGATPYKQQIGELIGVASSAIAIGFVLQLLNAAWGYGSIELPAPQAMLMKMLVEGVMGDNLPWILVFIGATIAVFVELLRIPVLPFAVGVYLPIHLNAAIFCGGLVRLYTEKRKNVSQEQKKEETNRGLLYSSGLIAGEGLIGILLALFALIPFGGATLGDAINISSVISLGNIGGLIIFGLLIASLCLFSLKRKRKSIRED